MTHSNPACRADLRPRLAYSAALLLLCAGTAALALDLLLLADTVRTRENDTSYAPLPQAHNESGLGRAGQLSLPSPLRLLEPLDGVLFAATTSRAAQPDGASSGRAGSTSRAWTGSLSGGCGPCAGRGRPCSLPSSSSGRSGQWLSGSSARAGAAARCPGVGGGREYRSRRTCDGWFGSCWASRWLTEFVLSRAVCLGLGVRSHQLLWLPLYCERE